MRWKTAFLVAIVAAGFADSAAADQASCKAYADEAVATVANQAKLGCNFGGGRWTTDWNAHYNACMDWSKDAKNGGTIAMNEYTVRSTHLAKCAAEKKGVEAPFGGEAPFKGDNAPNLRNFCAAYAYVAERQSVGAVRECGFSGPEWQSSFDQHRDACVSWGDRAGKAMANETYVRSIKKVACLVKIAGENKPPKDPDPAPPAGNVKVVADVTGYDKIDGQDVCYLHSGDTAKLVKVSNDNKQWVQIKGTSGDCNGKTVWVYNDGELKM